MHDILKIVGFSLLFLRFSYWVGLSFRTNEPQWKKVIFSQFTEGVLLLFIFAQLFGGFHFVPMQQTNFSAVVGFLLTIGGVVGSFLAKEQLGDAWVYAAASKVKPKQQLVTKGIYGIIRHPIYSCFIASYVGVELLVGSWLWVSMLFLFIPFYFQAKKEEALLLKHFGKTYRLYREKTKFFIPFIV